MMVSTVIIETGFFGGFCNSTNHGAASTINIKKYLLRENTVSKGLTVKERTKQDTAGCSRMSYDCVLK